MRGGKQKEARKAHQEIGKPADERIHQKKKDGSRKTQGDFRQKKEEERRKEKGARWPNQEERGRERWQEELRRDLADERRNQTASETRRVIFADAQIYRLHSPLRA